MKVSVFAYAKPNFSSSAEKVVRKLDGEFDKPLKAAYKDIFNEISAKAAGMCYLKDEFANVIKEPYLNTIKRLNGTLKNGHHSISDHPHISLLLVGIPKIFAMMLNNEKDYAASEKSARYTQMQLTEEIQKKYDEWMSIFIEEIDKAYPNEPFIQERKGNNPSRKEKLAQENARYLTSIDTPTQMIYTTSYRQLNYIYAFCGRYLEEETRGDGYDIIKEMIRPEVISFMKQLEELGLIDKRLIKNEKGREFSLFTGNYYKEGRTEIFMGNFATSYTGSAAMLAQSHRHRTDRHSVYTGSLNGEYGYYVPDIIADNDKLRTKWLHDIKEARGIPQGTKFLIYESGLIKDFILKAQERNCSCAQLEINNQMRSTAFNIHWAALDKPYELSDKEFKAIEGIKSGKSHCIWGTPCVQGGCGFADGINGTRVI